MDKHIKISKIAFDLAIFLCVVIIPSVSFPFVKTYERGFFCDDESLKHPFTNSTVKGYVLLIIGILIPFCITLIEYLRGRNRSEPKYSLLNLEISSWFVESYKQVAIFAFGLISQQLVVQIGKKLVGRLRPDFFDVCQPIMPDGTSCDNPINIGRYIEDFTCEAQHSTQSMLKNMRLSFPSGYSSFSAYTAVYCIIYLQSRMNWRGSTLLKHFIQLFLFLTAWFIALSRISDYKHHWSDVLAGSAIGIIFAIIVSQCVADFNQKNDFELPQTQNDLTATNFDMTTTNYQNPSIGHNNNNNNIPKIKTKNKPQVKKNLK